MRELKVRVWDRLKKQYVHDLYTLRHLVECSTSGFIYIGANAKDYPFIIEPSTGLKDKNGKEICKGDILKDKDYEGEVWTCKVEYDNNFAQFFCETNNGACWSFEDARGDEFEVIGNIHENPELLSESNAA